MKCSYKTASHIFNNQLVQLLDRVPLLSVGNTGARCDSYRRWRLSKRILEEDLSDDRLVIKLPNLEVWTSSPHPLGSSEDLVYLFNYSFIIRQISKFFFCSVQIRSPLRNVRIRFYLIRWHL